MPIQPDDVIYNKAAIIERCTRRIKEEYSNSPDLSNPSHIDAMTLNIERACQAAIDMAMHVVATKHLGIPQSSTEAFNLLKKAGLLAEELCHSLRAMTGFRNVAIHEYQELDLEILHYIAIEGHRDFIRFCETAGVRISE